MPRRKWDLKSAQQAYKEQGCELLATFYRDCRTPMPYRCKCGRESLITLDSFVRGQRCADCAGNRSFTQDEVEALFAAAGCQLLSVYHNARQKMDYRCVCGQTAQITLDSFKGGARCASCKEKKKIQTWLGKYGVTNPSLDPGVKEKMAETFMAKYGTRSPLGNLQIRAKCQQTMLERYGVANGFQLFRNYSKESQRLFWGIYDRLTPEHRLKTYFAELNKEFESQDPFFRYDFVISSIQKCIEYNGSVWHPKPELPEDATGWHLGDPHLRAGTFRKKEQIKHDQLLSRGFQILVVWDTDYLSDPTGTVLRCLTFLEG